jgi:hypothetical protein
MRRIANLSRGKLSRRDVEVNRMNSAEEEFQRKNFLNDSVELFSSITDRIL